MKKRLQFQAYIRRARQRFLEGTWHRTPADAVRAKVKTLEAWVDILNEEREREHLIQTQSATPRRQARAESSTSG